MKKYTAHGAIILSLFYLTLYVIDRINRPMLFIENDITKALILVLAFASVVNSIVIISDERKKIRKALAKKASAKKIAAKKVDVAKTPIKKKNPGIAVKSTRR